ncbi:hypothetical protein JC794_01205 [Morganella morganii]|uniref:hypothetical protein n=1 Tax=Morganella morganii TaxID=582 RepID=UPI000D1F9376|nr:hypothetical protein [Morganella morganii]HAE79725.1 hypothetical protein [Morganella sp. (in: enterobacteria)]QXO52085.1 hypothetical protein JC861_01290 [Morganella morganii]QXO55949.1 hypothetical protein JC830_01190 [Morganella morganii]QXO63604.1 hypothetical protein JC826_01265 [Morganella morganii]QXO78799.1 hypothetical protein JC794_01205 [Morganella morganii]
MTIRLSGKFEEFLHGSFYVHLYQGLVLMKEVKGMYLKHDISEIKKMNIAERKTAAMRQLKASFDQACREGKLRYRRADILQ